jgi:transposase
VDLYRKVRLACAEGMSQREAARHFNVSRDSVTKMMAFSVPPGYRRTAPVKRPKLDAFTGIIDGWLDGDREVHRKQRHTAKRVFERLRDEHGFTGGSTIAKDYMRQRERRGREMFVPLAHPPGHAQADFGEAVVVIGGVEQKAHFFVMDLPHSDACFVRACRARVEPAPHVRHACRQPHPRIARHRNHAVSPWIRPTTDDNAVGPSTRMRRPSDKVMSTRCAVTTEQG